MSSKSTHQMLLGNVGRVVTDSRRLEALRAHIPRTDQSDPDFDALTSIAARIFDAPVCLISLVDEEIQWFKSCVGLDDKETEVSASFCAHAISAEKNDLFVVLDALRDLRFSNNRLVTGEPHIRFYAGYPIMVGGQRVGTICAIDTLPRDAVTTDQEEALKSLAGLASSLFELKFTQGEAVRLERRQAEHGIRNALQQAVARTASWAWYPQGKILTYDKLLQEMLDLPDIGKVSLKTFLDQIDQPHRRKLQALLSSEEWLDEDTATRLEFSRNGGRRWFELIGRPTTESAGSLRNSLLGIIVETTETRKSAESKRQLLRELNHRVKNTLSILQALSTQTARATASPQEYNDIFFRRVQSVNMTHGLLSDNEWTGITLRDVINGQLAVEPEGFSGFPIDVPEIELSSDQAFGIGLVLHELFNTVDRIPDADDTGTGRRLVGRLEGPASSGVAPVLHLHWQDGFPPSSTEKPEKDRKSRHAAHRLKIAARGLDKVLGSRVHIDESAGGIAVDISFPVPA